MSVRAVLFDLGDTVVRLDPFPSDVAGAFEVELSAYFGPRCHAIAVNVAARIAEDVREAHRTVRRDEVDIPAIVRAVLTEAGIASPETLASGVADAHGRADVGRILDVPGRAQFLDGLCGRGYRLAIVSNTTTRSELLVGMLERFGLLPYFDALVFSSQVGVRKPHAAIYEAALRELAIEPTDALFVGDRLREDVLGPRQLGMRAVLTHEFVQDAHSGEPDAIISRLVDLEGVLEHLNAHRSSA
ncbi:MAG: HAD family hydrolase [Dehalococcoidia bacterium]|nr:HAD family hydrolase [Dehalococcoidia bacterium]MCB9484674.1 HAD family hydrolase [Thermoflexaceae bacterium]